MERKIGYSSNKKTIFRDFLGFWDFAQKKIPIPGIWDFSGFWLRDFLGEKKSQIPGIWDLGIGIPKKSHPKATSGEKPCTDHLSVRNVSNSNKLFRNKK